MTDHYVEQVTTPDLDELLQQDAEPGLATVPVRTVEPIEAYNLPNRRAFTEQYSLVGNTFQTVLDGTPKRARAVIVSMDEDIMIRVSSSGTGTPWPAREPYVVSHTMNVSVACRDSGAETTIGVTQELWAD